VYRAAPEGGDSVMAVSSRLSEICKSTDIGAIIERAIHPYAGSKVPEEQENQSRSKAKYRDAQFAHLSR